MDKDEIKEEMIEIQTVHIAVNDKLHRIQENFLKIEIINDNLQRRIDILKKEIECGK